MLCAAAGEVMLGDLFREGFDITVRARVRYSAAVLRAQATCAMFRHHTRTRTPSL